MRRNNKNKTLLAILLIAVVSVFMVYRLTKPESKLSRMAKERARELGKNLIQHNFEVLIYEGPRKEPESRTLASASESTASNNGIKTQLQAELQDELIQPRKVIKTSGEIGRDPWGQPFQFQTVEQANKKKLIIWSTGADGKIDSRIEDLLQEKSSEDDLVVSIEM